MTWKAKAQALLSAAEAATLSSPVARSVIAPGPDFARDCRMLAVYLDQQNSVTATASPTSGLPGSGCAVIPTVRLTLAFVADCVPAPGDSGQPPAAAAVTAWTEAFLDDAEVIWNAVADAALDGTLGDCDDVTIEAADTRGPLGQVAQFIIPVSVLGD